MEASNADRDSRDPNRSLRRQCCLVEFTAQLATAIVSEMIEVGNGGGSGKRGKRLVTVAGRLEAASG